MELVIWKSEVRPARRDVSRSIVNYFGAIN